MLQKNDALGHFRVGEKGRVVGYDLQQSAYRQKLLALGLTPGTPFEVVRKAPLGCPIEIAFRAYRVSLRTEEIAILRVTSDE